MTRKPFAIGRLTSDDTMPPRPLSSNIPPIYPNQLRAANIEGQVVVRFIVRPDSSADMLSFQVVKSDHELFTAAVKNALPSYKFAPARVNGVAASWLTDLTFTFSVSK